jgi:hypothetical protein
MEIIGQPGEPAFVHFVGIGDGRTEIKAFDNNVADHPLIVDAEHEVIPDGRKGGDIFTEGITEKVTREFADQSFSFEDETVDPRPWRQGIRSLHFDLAGSRYFRLGCFFLPAGLGMSRRGYHSQKDPGTAKKKNQIAIPHVFPPYVQQNKLLLQI